MGLFRWIGRSPRLINDIVVCALGKKPESINYNLTTSSYKPAESDKYFPCKKVDTSVVIPVLSASFAPGYKLKTDKFQQI